MNIPCDGCKIKGVCDHIREVFEELRGRGIKCTVSMPTYRGKPVTMWTLIPQKQMPPTRLFRYCCQVLKESSTPHRMIATGVRAAESVGRRGRDVFSVRGKTKADARFYSFDHAAEVYDEAHMDLGDAWDCRFITAAKKREDLICNPIYEWSDADVWDYIRGMGIKYNPLYDQGYYRVGCVGCPLGGGGQDGNGGSFQTSQPTNRRISMLFREWWTNEKRKARDYRASTAQIGATGKRCSIGG